MASTVQEPWQKKWLVPAIWAGLFLLLLMPLVVTPSTLFPFVVGKATYTRGLIAVLFVLWVPLAVASPHYRLGNSWVLTIFGLYIVVNAASALVGVSFEHSFWGDYRRMGGVFDLVHWFVLLLILASMVRTTIHWRWLLNANLGVSFVLGLLGLAQHYDVDVFQSLFWYFETKQRLDITFGNPTYVGAYMLVNVLMAMAFLADSFVRSPAPKRQHRHRRRRREASQEVPYQLWALRFFWLMVIPLNLFVMTLSGTRGAVVGLVAAVLLAGVLYALLGSRNRLRVGLGVATAVILVVALSFPFLQDTAIYDRIATSNVTLGRLRSAPVESRAIMARIGLEAFASKPILGWGPENFVFAFQRYVKLSDFPQPLVGDQVHNRVINELTTTGVVGFTVYMLLWGRISWVLVRKMRADPGEDVLTVGLAAALAGYFVQNLFLFDVHATFLQAALLTGWVASTEVNLRTSRMDFDADPAASNSLTRRGSGQVQASTINEVASGWWGSWASRISALVNQETMRGSALRWGGATLLMLLLAASLWFVIGPSYRAAQHFPKQTHEWDELWTEARRSFQTFPPLATLPRQVLFDTLVENWDVIRRVGVPEIVGKVQPEELAALASDPKNPRLYLALGELYQKAAETQPQYVERARRYVERAEELAPEVMETLVLMVSQAMLEEDYQRALDIIEEYDYGQKYKLIYRVEDMKELAEKQLRSEAGEAER